MIPINENKKTEPDGSSALMVLHEAYASNKSGASEYFNRIHHTQHLTKTVINASIEPTNLEVPVRSCVREASPFTATLLYQMATANLRRCLEMKTDVSIEALAVMKSTLEGFNDRWKASGE